MDLCILDVTEGNFTGYYQFSKGFYRLSDIPTIFLEGIDQTLENKHPAWLDDLIVVTKSSKQKKYGRASRCTIKIRKRRLPFERNQIRIIQNGNRMDHKIDQNGFRPLQDKILAIK